MAQDWIFLILSLGYIGLLFAIAYLGDRRPDGWPGLAGKPLVYALSLAIYCTSWTFYGSVGRAASIGPDFIMIYVGPILVMTLGYGVLERMVRLAKQHNITSIADFIGSRYGKSRAVAALATVIAAIGVLPYIALQLRAVTATFDALLGADNLAALMPEGLLGDSALLVAAMLALFTILFGIRVVQATEQHRGMMLAIAFESLVKLAAFMAAGLFVWLVVLGGGEGFAAALEAEPWVAERIWGGGLNANWLVLGLLSALAFLCLPRQFHVAVVEHNHPDSLRSARWLFPLYLIVINLFVVPIAAAGLLALPPGSDPDLFVLTLPLLHGMEGLSLLVFIGGLSAATSMVIVACLALSIMISNELVIPLLLGRREREHDLGRLVLTVRRLAVVAVLFAAYAYTRFSVGNLPLVSLGLISFAAIAQFGPPLLLGLFWRGAHRHGAVAGLVGGFIVWAYDLLLPSLLGGGERLLVVIWPSLSNILDPFSQGVLASLSVNLLLLVLGSLLARPGSRDREQALAFVGADARRDEARLPARARADLTVADLKALTARFIGAEQAERAFAGLQDGPAAAAFTERLLSGVVGAASARIVLASLRPAGQVSARRARAMLDEAGEAIVHNVELLRTTLDHISQGIGVFDGKGRLATWNDAFLALLRLPREAAAVGMLRQRLAALAPQGVDQILRRLDQRQPVVQQVDFADGGAIELRIDPMPGGGFSITVTDVTERRQAERALRLANETLERRVAERTADLTNVIAQLDGARAAAEEANLGKTRFIAAASHDLLQPLHAARLFTAALAERQRGEPLVEKIDQGLGAVEALLDTLLDISRLDAGVWRAEPRPLALQPLIDSLVTALAPLAQRRGIELVVVPTRAAVTSDPQLLRRVLQNLLSNAIRYSDPARPRSRVLIGVRRAGAARLRVEVWDCGSGIPESERERVFGEFVRLGPAREREELGERGLGLGLAIVRRICRLLDHPVSLRSWPGRRSVFAVSLPVTEAPSEGRKPRPEPRQAAGALASALVLAIDDEPAVLEGVVALMTSWGCEVLTARSQSEAEALLKADGRTPDLLLVDLDLGEGPDGLAVVTALRQRCGSLLPAALVTATRDERLRRQARLSDVEVLHKPLRPASLRALVQHAYRSVEVRRQAG